jgi:hypothetical protein
MWLLVSRWKKDIQGQPELYIETLKKLKQSKRLLQDLKIESVL